MAPFAVIAIGALIGLAAAGLPGLLLGAVAGFLVTLVISLVVRTAQGGALPRKVRRTLAVNMLTNHREAVRLALPGLQGDALLHRIEELVEEIGRHSVRHAPTPGEVWTETAVTLGLADMISLAPTDELRQLYRCMLEQIRRDWYSVNYLRGVVEP